VRNTDNLAKLYDRLTPRERLPLLIAAGARGDETERKRLIASAPKQRFQVADYFELGQALAKAVDQHLLMLLDLAANFWQWWGLWLSYGRSDQGGAGAKKGQGRKVFARKAKEFRAAGVARYYAARFVAYVEGWKLFCSEMHIDPQVLLNFMPGWETITRTETEARELAFTPEEAALFVRIETATIDGDDCLEKGPVPVETAQGLAEAWHGILDKLVQRSA
jgi:hypothetical protein